MTDETPQTTNEAAGGQSRAEGANLTAVLDAIATAYGYLWHVNNEPGTPNQYRPERAAYEARKVLRELLTHEQRGNGINRVRAEIMAANALVSECPEGIRST